MVLYELIRSIAEKYATAVKDMYDDNVTSIRCAAGMTESFKMEVGLHL